MKLLIIILLVLCNKSYSKNNILVEVSSLKKQEIQDEVEYWGRLRPKKIKNIFAPIEGVIIEKIKYAGENVKKNQTILLFESTRFDEGQKKFNVDVPISGVLLNSPKDVGDLFKRNELLGSVFTPSGYYVNFRFSPKDASNLIKGQIFKSKIGTKEVPITIKSVGKEIERKSGTVKVIAEINSNENLLTGSLVKANFKLFKRKSFIVDPTHIYTQGNNEVIYKLNEDNTITGISISRGFQSKTKIEIKAKDLKTPLVEGLKYVSKSNQRYLYNNAKVEIDSKETKKAMEVKKK